MCREILDTAPKRARQTMKPTLVGEQTSSHIDRRNATAALASGGDYHTGYSAFVSMGKTNEVNPCPYDLSKECRRQICHIATTLNFRRGTTIYSQGADAHFIYFIEKGVVRLSRFAENGHRQVLGFHVAGDLIGLAENGQYANLAETVCVVQVQRVPWNQMLCLMLAAPQLQLAILHKVVHDSLQAQSLIMVLGQQNTYQRLASCLVNLLREPQFFDKQSARLCLPVNRFDLADYLGVASRSAERAFVRLEQQGLVRRVTPRIIEILDIDGLKRLQLEQRRSPHKGAHSVAP